MSGATDHERERPAADLDLDAAVDRAITHVARTLDLFMAERGLSTRDVAGMAGVSVGTVHAVRNGTTRLEARVLARLEAALDLTLWPPHAP